MVGERAEVSAGLVTTPNPKTGELRLGTHRFDEPCVLCGDAANIFDLGVTVIRTIRER